MSSKKPAFGTKLGYWVIYGSCYLVGLLPYWFLYYVVVEVLYFFVYKLGRYRIQVVRENLALSFPEKSKKELSTIERRFYHNLSEYFIDSIELAGISKETLKKRCVLHGRDELNRELDGRNWIAMLAHFGNWEIMSVHALHPEMSVVVAPYRPLKNKAFDMYYKKVRHRFAKSRSVPMNELMRHYIANQEGIDGHSVNLVLVADQNVPLNAKSQWIPFLNHPTVFFQGGEKIARKFNLPVYYMHIRKVKRAHYEQRFEMIWDGKSPTKDHEITNRYAALLENDIRECPELWMWSHRRWKWSPKGDALKEYNERLKMPAQADHKVKKSRCL